MDFVIIALALLGVVLGYIRGLISQLFSIVGLFIAYVVAFLFYDDLAPWIAKMIPISSWDSYEQYQVMLSTLRLDIYFYNAVSFALIFFSAKIALSVIGHFLQLIAKVPGLNAVNKWSGAFLALIEVIVLVIVAVNVMGIIPSDEVQTILSNSYIAEFLNEHIAIAAGKLHDLWDQSG